MTQFATGNVAYNAYRIVQFLGQDVWGETYLADQHRLHHSDTRCPVRRAAQNITRSYGRHPGLGPHARWEDTTLRISGPDNTLLASGVGISRLIPESRIRRVPSSSLLYSYFQPLVGASVQNHHGCRSCTIGVA